MVLTARQYMNYDRYSQDPIHSPMFNGNSSSMGGNGAPDPTYKGVRQPGRTPNIIATGGGGGCVTEGPFKESVTTADDPAPLSVAEVHKWVEMANAVVAWSSASG